MIPPPFAGAAGGVLQLGREFLHILPFVANPNAPCPTPCMTDRSPMGLATFLDNLCNRVDTPPIATTYPEQANSAAAALDSASKARCTAYRQLAAQSGRPDGSPTWTSAGSSWEDGLQQLVAAAEREVFATQSAVHDDAPWQLDGACGLPTCSGSPQSQPF